MRFESIYVNDKNGQQVCLRNAEESDAADLLHYLKTTTAETPYLIREPDEVTLTLEQEVSFIRNMIEAERELLLVAIIDGKHIGNCSMSALGTFKRYAHRCSVAIALYQAYCGRGIGTLMMQTILDVARVAGYEQAELEVISSNSQAISLYKKLGFQSFGHFPNNMKYADGTYADAEWMIKLL